MSTNQSRRRLGELLAGNWSIGEPTVHEGLAVYPVYGPPSLHRFASLSSALRAGLSARELPPRASDQDVWVDNRTASNTLVFGGEELRSDDERLVCHESWLIRAGRKTWLPVCRLDAPRARRSRLASFETTDRISAPRVRRYEAFLARTRGTPGYGATRAPLPELLDEMLDRERSIDTEELESATRSFVLHDGQSGALFAIGDRFVSFDWVARAEAYADLHRRLVRGCLTEAMGVTPRGDAPTVAEARRWIDRMRDTTVVVAESKHAADSVRPLGAADGRVRLEAAGVALDDTLLHWSAFPADAPILNI